MTTNLPSIGLPYDWYQILSDKQAGKLEEGVECWCNVNEPSNLANDVLCNYILTNLLYR
jgi:hypothetical protein